MTLHVHHLIPSHEFFKRQDAEAARLAEQAASDKEGAKEPAPITAQDD